LAQAISGSVRSPSSHCTLGVTPMAGLEVDSQSCPRRFAFVFPMASGHINPSLPVARALVELGHEVHYLCCEQMRDAIEDTGAKFHCEAQWKPELFDGREADLFGATPSLRTEYGLLEDLPLMSMFKLMGVQMELMLPGMLRWLRELQPSAVVYCPILNKDASYASKALGIPSVALLTMAGPGSMATALEEIITSMSMTSQDMREALGFSASTSALKRVLDRHGLHVDMTSMAKPLGYLEVLEHSQVTLVTTSEDLQDPLTPELQAAYEKHGVAFAAVGPLLDHEGACRAAGHKYNNVEPDGVGDVSSDEVVASPASQGQESPESVIASARRARAAGRRVVLVSMGTVVTGDSSEFGWEGRSVGADGQPRGLTGRELCRAVWAAVFDALGTTSAEMGPLLVVALGPQPNALGDVQPPPNAICMPVVPQVDVLRAGVDVFLTHGGQNSFTEALANAVPMVVCPGFGDQAVNARKAEQLGVGLQVPRPEPEAFGEATAIAAFRADVSGALGMVLGGRSFVQAVSACSERLCLAGGVPRAVELVVTASGSHPRMPRAFAGA